MFSLGVSGGGTTAVHDVRPPRQKLGSTVVRMNTPETS